jgi:hypothetical protein
VPLQVDDRNILVACPFVEISQFSDADWSREKDDSCTSGSYVVSTKVY